MGLRILGIDPGIRVTGFGLVEETEDGLSLVHCGVIKTLPKMDDSRCLQHLYDQVSRIIAGYQPSQLAVEEPFVAKNVRAAMRVGQAMAVAMLAAAHNGLPVRAYSPAYIKQAITNYGRGNKEQVQEMVKLELGLKTVPHPDDAADALAVAICHYHQLRAERALEERA